ncbi:hypothetical protein CSHISOI_03915 [Colletotrichum shisoi]|uniref:Uncharacterized protein n=1 Tax=Colletotrichum shisoi TaxID=2078593 RepID=A0A5Q4BWU7_9PEZI|nr:hypothetical protein CSHISOI_03915 [Colletotrichum shisoi]
MSLPATSISTSKFSQSLKLPTPSFPFDLSSTSTSSSDPLSEPSQTGSPTTSVPSQTVSTSTTEATSTKPGDATSSGSGTNLAAIIGGVLGSLALICITIILVIYIIRSNKEEKRKTAAFNTVINPHRPDQDSQKPRKRGLLTLSGTKRRTQDSDVSSLSGVTLNNAQETLYPDPPDDKAHPEAGWGPSEAQGSEVQRYPRGPWELNNETRPSEMSDYNRPAELPDYTFLKTLPTIPQAPTRQDSWRPNDDGAAWGDMRLHPRLRDRLSELWEGWRKWQTDHGARRSGAWSSWDRVIQLCILDTVN